MFGHIHQDKVKIQQPIDIFKPERGSTAKSYVLICPSITTVHGSNPAFRLFTADESDSKLTDYSQYFMDFTTANSKNFLLNQTARKQGVICIK